jgi:hypothetical protein
MMASCVWISRRSVSASAIDTVKKHDVRLIAHLEMKNKLTAFNVDVPLGHLPPRRRGCLGVRRGAIRLGTELAFFRDGVFE